MSAHIIEQVTFKLAAGVSEDEFLKIVPATSEFISAQPGFVCRRLSLSDGGVWHEHVEWKTLEDANRASEKFMKHASVAPFMGMVEEKSVTMAHHQLKVSVG
ncbi:MAG: hypothetical protein GXP01_07095 [Alphaproteobacteria bacterium]|nr:hypothetical protein [Alphaproteobacteria bacterium]